MATKKFLVTFCALVIVAALAMVMFMNLNDANSRNAKLEAQLTDLQERVDEVQTEYYSLLWNYSSLEWNFTNILLQTPTFAPNPGVSEPTNSSYISRYQALENLYLNLKKEYDAYVKAYRELRDLTEQRLLRGSATRFVTISHPDIVSLAHNITGRVDNSTSEPNWGEIKALYDWVNNNIEYREDGLYPVLPENPGDLEKEGLEQTDQMVQLPNETLALRKGDCEDSAVLLCSLLRAYFNNQYTAECIWITGETAGHVAVMIPFAGEKIAILDPVRDYFSHDTLGDIALNSVSVEIYNWMNIWRPSLGNDVHVYRVFSDYMDKNFESTEEFINWMYNR